MDTYEFDVFTAAHDDVKAGRTQTVRSRVLISAAHYTAAEAYDLAACLAVARHGGMPTSVHPRI